MLLAAAPFLLAALPQQFLLAALPQHSVAVLRSGERVPCAPATRTGDFLIDTPWGRLDATTDPVTDVVDPAGEIQLLRSMRELDAPAWIARASQRALVGELRDALAMPELAPEDRDRLLTALEGWGRRIDPIPARSAPDERVDWLWERLAGADPARGALLSGRLLAEIPAGEAPAKQRVGLVDLRRALRGDDPVLRRAAALVAEHQFETDLVRPLAELTLDEAEADVELAAARALLGLDERRALGGWTLALLREGKAERRARAAELLGRSARPEAVEPLITAVAAAYRQPGRFVFFGRQISLVTDFDIEVAQAAAIADPVTSVITEGQVLEVRLVSTFVSRAAMQGLRQLTQADPGPSEQDWLRWYEERRATQG